VKKVQAEPEIPRMKQLRVLALVDEAFVPPESPGELSPKALEPLKTEYDVVMGLRQLGHETSVLGVASDLSIIGKAIEEQKPHIVFNLLEEFRGQGVYVPYLLGYLELLHQPYTGCNPAGMLLTHSKAVSKKILKYHRIRVPEFHVFPRERKTKRPKHLSFPLIVKSTTEHGSVGISLRSIVSDDESLAQQVQRVHEDLGTDAIVEQFIEGRELYVAMLGNHRLQTFPIWELHMKGPEGQPVIATERAKWDKAYQKKQGVRTAAADIDPALGQRIARICKRAYRILGQTGYARMDLRLSENDDVYLLESNPNPQLAQGEDFADAALSVGIDYASLIQRILNLGLRATGFWRG
jgi:D-alanine-D-alanine ligase